MSEPIAEIKRYVGIREELTRGVPETSPEFHIDVKSCSPGDPSNPEIVYEGSMGRGKNIHRPGYYVLSPSMEHGVDLKVLSRLLYFAAGERLTKETEGAGTGLDPEVMSYYDNSADTFTSKKTAFKNATANDVPVPGHAEAEEEDYLLFGDQEQFTIIAVTTGTAKTDTSTLVWEYWDGDSWATLSVTDGTVGFTEVGAKTITWTAPVDWEPRSVNDSVSCYFVRCRCSAFTTAGTAGAITSGTIGTEPDTLTEYIYTTDSLLLPSFTSFMGVDIDEHVVSGNVVDSFELTADSDFLSMKVDSKAQNKTIDTLKELDDLLLNSEVYGDYPLTWAEVKLHFREYGSETVWGTATDVSTDTKKCVFGIKNSASDQDGKRIGSRFPGYIPVGGRDLSLSFDYLYLTNDWIIRLNGGDVAPGESISSTEFEMMLEIDAGEHGEAYIYFPRVIVSSAPLQSSGRAQIVQNIQIAIFNDTVTIPTDVPVDVKTDMLATINLKFPDTSGSFDGVWPPART